MSKKKVLWLLSGIAILFLVLLNTSGCGQVEQTDKQEHVKTQRLIVGGSGTNLPITRTLAKAFMEKNPEIQITIPESLGSTGGIKSVQNGVISLGLVSRELTTDEQKSGLTHLPYGKVLIVFATNNGQKIDNLTTQQIVDIYSGKIKNWQEIGGTNQKIMVLTREYNDSSKLIWDKYIPGFKDINMTSEAILLRTDQSMDEAILNIASSIGWTDLGSITLNRYSVNVPKLNGIEPTYEMITKGKYPYYKNLAFVFKGKPIAAASKFIEFVNSSEGSKILLNNGYQPITN